MAVPTSTPDHPPPLIQASELSQFSFCQRAWWLSTVQGQSPPDQNNLVRGKRVHSRHAHQVRAALFWHRAGLFLLTSGGLFLLAAILWLWFF